jgi:chemotaxis family two-component system sensor kinase Cph1
MQAAAPETELDRLRRRVAELESKVSELEVLLDSVPVLISYITPDQRFRRVNRAYEQMFDVRKESVIGKTVQELTGELHYRRAKSFIERALAGEQVSFDSNVRHKDGTQHDIEVTYSPEICDGSVRGIAVFVRDVTAERRAQAAVHDREQDLLRAEKDLRRSEERHRVAVEAGKVGLWSWDIASDRIEWSDMIYNLHGIRPGAFDGTVQAFAALVYADDRQRVAEALESALRGDGAGDYHVEFRTLRDGVLRWLFTNGRVLFDKGRPVQMFGAVIDITESKLAAEALRRSNKELRRANEDLNQFAYSASHDLKEPLRMVSLYTQLLKRRYADRLDEEAMRFIDYSVDGAQRMDRLVSDLLAYTQIINADSAEPPVPVDTSFALKQVLSNLHAPIEESRAVITTGELPVVHWREVHVVQVLQRLICNAINYRHHSRPPEIHVSAARKDKVWELSVRDNGIGVDARYHERIFGIFKRLHNNTRYQGTGIGLAICQKVVERNGGRIWLESDPGHGSTFYFTCPIA